MKIFTSCACSGLFALLLSTSAIAEPTRLALNPGFRPDPTEESGRSGGTIASECGNIAEEANYELTLDLAFDYLRISAVAGGDITLYLEYPDGRKECYDDEIDGQLPEVAGPFSAGTYQIWIGDRGNSTEYRLYFTEMPR
mgnify:CR=1 FL=1